MIGDVMKYWALKRYAKKLAREADKSPKRTASLKMPYLARRNFDGFEGEEMVDLIEERV